jgi:hypothetical protein
MFLNKSQVQTILDNAPVGVDKVKLLDGLIKKGYDIEGVDSESRRKELTPVEDKKEPGFVEGLKNDLNTRADKVGAIMNRDQSGLEKGVQVFGQGAGAAANAIEKTAEQIPGVKQGLEKLGQGINWLATSDLSPLKKLGDVIGSSEKVQELVNLYDTDQDFKDTVDGVANIARLGGDVQAVVEGAMFAKNVTSKLAQVTAAGADAAGGAIESVVTKAGDTVGGATDALKVKMAAKNANPQLQSSAERLFLKGASKRVESPTKLYDAYASQSKKALGDVKVDPAIAQVGDEIGDVFKKVVSERRKVGATMAEELKKVKDVPTDVLPTIDTFVQDLAGEGLAYDRVSKVIKQTANQTKMTAEDLSILQDYAVELQKLGSKPTIGDLDAFMSRIPKQIDVYKSGKNITGTTNAERIVKKSLSDLRTQFDPATTGNKALAGYAKARSQYAQLSDFIEEGEGFLGKVTQSGDFAKDASLAKSSVQSVLNNGKKDWLIQLEELTGYPALDNSVLALQAMKDVGDFRGLSLLEKVSEGSVPVSKAGVTQKVIDYTLKKGVQAVVGSPEEQTRAFLQSLEKSQKQAKSAQINAAKRARTGDRTKRIRNSKNTRIEQK